MGELASKVVARLYDLFHAGTAFDAGHAQVNAQAERCVQALTPLFAPAAAEEFCVTVVGDQIYVNGTLVQADDTMQAPLAWLIEFAQRRSVGQIHILRDPKALDIASVTNRLLSTQPEVGLPFAIETTTFSVAPLLRDEEHEELVGHLTYASRFSLLRLYAEALAAMNTATSKRAATQGPNMATRLAARLIDAYQRDPSGLLGLVCLRPLPGSVANRRLDTAIVLIGMAQMLNFNRSQTLELISTALAREFAGQEVAWWVREPNSPYEAAKSAFRAAEPLRILTTFEAAAPVGLQVPNDFYGREVQPHVATLLMHVAAGYVDLQQPGDSSNPFSPETALQLIFAQTGKFFERAAVGALAGALGLWPPGCVVRLNSGDVAVVVHRPRPGAPAHRPFVRPVELSGGSAIYDLSRPELGAYEICSSAQRADCAVNPMFVFLQ